MKNVKFDELLKVSLKDLRPNQREKLTPLLNDIYSIMDIAKESEDLNRESIHLRWGLRKDVQNWEEMRKNDILAKRSFDLEPMNYSDPNDLPLFIANKSLFSYRFGIRASDASSISNKRYRCNKCGEYESSMSGERCPLCGGETVYKYDVRAYAVLKGFKVFNPHWLNLFLSNTNKSLTKKDLVTSLFTYISPKKKTSPNILDLQNREVLEEWIRRYSAPDKVDIFLETIDKAMSSVIPILSKDFRTYQIKKQFDGSVVAITDPLNKYYINIAKKVDDLNDITTGRKTRADSAKIQFLSSINNNLLDLHAECLRILGDGKESMIRGKIGGRRKGHSCRLVVEGLVHPKVDACTLPYSFFGELFIDYHKETFIKYGMDPHSENRMKNNIPNRIDRIIMAKVLKELKEKHQNYILVYRAPCIYLGSILSMEIIGLSRDSDCIRVHDTALDAGLSGDKDQHNRSSQS